MLLCQKIALHNYFIFNACCGTYLCLKMNKHIKGGATYAVTFVCQKIALNYCLIIMLLWNIYTILNDKLNQRIPQYSQEYNDTH